MDRVKDANVVLWLSYVAQKIHLNYFTSTTKYSVHVQKIMYWISVPCKVECREIDPATWKLGLTDFVKICKKMFFFFQLSFWRKNSHNLFQIQGFAMVCYCLLRNLWFLLNGLHFFYGKSTESIFLGVFYTIWWSIK